MDGMKKLKIDQMLFLMAFGQDEDYQYDEEWTYYLNNQTGELLFIDKKQLDNDTANGRQNRENKDIVNKNPGDFLEIPGKSHGECHEMLQDFIGSEWTRDESKLDRAAESYDNSIGRWMNRVDEETKHAFDDYKCDSLTKEAEEFLKENGIEVGWI